MLTSRTDQPWWSDPGFDCMGNPIGHSDERKTVWCFICHDQPVSEPKDVCNICPFLPLSEWEGFKFTSEQWQALMAARDAAQYREASR